MAYVVNSAIEHADVINKFTSSVVNAITANAYDLVNPPMDGQYQCVPSEMMDSIENIPVPEIGVVGQKISAETLINALVDLTTNLTRLGTFSYKRYMRESEEVLNPNGETRVEYDEIYGYSTKTHYRYGHVFSDKQVLKATRSGKVLFTNDYVRTLKTVSNIQNTVINSKITIADINALCSACLSSWKSTTKYNYDYTNNTCHVQCHNNCYSDCHSSCRSSCYSD